MNESKYSSSTARNKATSNGFQPSTSGPSVICRISSSVRLHCFPITTCCPHSYFEQQSHPIRSIRISRSLGGSEDLNSTWLLKTLQHFRSFEWFANMRIMLGIGLSLFQFPCLQIFFRSLSHLEKSKGIIRGLESRTISYRLIFLTICF